MKIVLDSDEISEAIKRYVSEKLDVKPANGMAELSVYDENGEQVLPDEFLSFTAEVEIELSTDNGAMK